MVEEGSYQTMDDHALFAALTKSAATRLNQPLLLLQDGTSITFGRMLEECARVSAWLENCGLRSGDRLVAQVDKSPAAVMLYLGCIRSGVVFVPLNVAYTGSEVGYFLSDAKPALLAASPSSAAASAPFVGRRELLEKSIDKAPWSRFDPLTSTPVIAANDPAAILYTSGTTGRSKGAILTHRNLSSNAAVLHSEWRWRENDVLLHALPIYHAHGLFVALHCALINGSSIIFHEGFEAAAVLRDLPRATVFMGVPTFYTRLLSEPSFDAAACSNTRVFISGSAPLLEATFKEFAARTGHEILERYGMTEALMVTSNPYDGPRRAGTVGRPLPGVQVRIAVDGNAQAQPNQTGILQLKGPNLFAGYWRDPDKTAEEHTVDGYFVSGDIAIQDELGSISLVGRAKDLIISGGFNVYPKEIESIIDSLAGVAESAVVGVPHPDFGEGVVAIVVSEPGASVDAAAIHAAMSERLAAFKRPKKVIAVDELPRNAMGKVQKANLRSQYAGLFANI